MPAQEARIKALEDRVSKLETADAVDQERHKSIITRLDKIDGHINKLLWLIIAAIVAAFMNFLIKGGFNG